MSIESDRWIREQAANNRIMEPFREKSIAGGVLSYRLRSYGNDRRVSNEFKSFTRTDSAIIDPKQFDEKIVRCGRGRLGDRSAGFVRAGVSR
jgi:dCTP deaminase